jgi:hypothetical protein
MTFHPLLILSYFLLTIVATMTIYWIYIATKEMPHERKNDHWLRAGMFVTAIIMPCASPCLRYQAVVLNRATLLTTRRRW